MTPFFQTVAEQMVKKAHLRLQVPKECQSPEMLRLTSIAIEAGQDMAKTAAGLLGWKGKALLGAGVLGAGYGAVKGIGALKRTIGAGAQPATYGNPRFSYRVPNATNEYGQPSFGTSL